MKLEKIITLTETTTVRKIRFLAMERSLRSVGCDIPILVIPFNEGRFDLPKNSKWWEVNEISDWLKANKALPFLRKYQALTTSNYQFADTDVIFIKNPVKELLTYNNFVICCSHWKDWKHTCTDESEKWMKKRDTLWQRKAFNSGQFACEPQLYDTKSLIAKATEPDIRYTCLNSGPDQAGVNALVFASGVEITNLTLPPHNYESSWAGDYEAEYEKHWVKEKTKPYLIHWAGMPMHKRRYIDNLFYDFLTLSEKKEFQEAYENEVVRKFARRRSSLRGLARRAKKAVQAAVHAWKE